MDLSDYWERRGVTRDARLAEFEADAPDYDRDADDEDQPETYLQAWLRTYWAHTETRIGEDR